LKKDEAAAALYGYAQALFRWNEFKLINNVVNNLNKYDATMARAVDFEYRWRIYDFDGAIEIYQEGSQWSDVTHQQQANIMMELLRFADAGEVISKIQDQELQRTMLAKKMYLQGRYKELARLKPQNDAERLWQLTALADRNIKKAGASLAELSDNLTLEEPQLRVLIRYYGVLQDNKAMDRYTRQLVSLVDKRVDRMTKALNFAINNKAALRAKTLLTRIESLNPNVKDLETLRQKVNAMDKNNASAT